MLYTSSKEVYIGTGAQRNTSGSRQSVITYSSVNLYVNSCPHF